MKKYLLCIGFVFCYSFSFAVLKTWIGGSAGAWSTGTNWSTGAAPTAADDVEILTTTVITMDANPVVNSLKISSNSVVEFAGSTIRAFNVLSTSLVTPGLLIDAGSTLTVSESGAFSFTLNLTGGAGVTGKIFGTLNFVGSVPSATPSLVLWAAVANYAALTVYNTGIIQYDINSGDTNGGTISTTLSMEAGSQYILLKNGGNIPGANFKNGSIIRIKGVTNTFVLFPNYSIYSGLIEWNCPGQTITGTPILNSTNGTIDSLRIISTGTGSVRMTTNPSGYTIGHLEVQGGIIQMGAPSGAINGTGSITTDLKISGGTVLGNATYATDLGTARPMTVTVHGNVIITGGTLDLTNRPTALLPGGACQLNVAGNFLQTAGTVTATSSFGSQNQVNMNGVVLQNAEMDNVTGPLGLVISNTSGVSLLNNINLPSALNIQNSCYLRLNNFNATVGASLVFSNVSGKIVTNGTGALKVTGLTASSSQLFPVAPSTSTYNPVTLTPSLLAFSPNTYSVRVTQPGLIPTIFIPNNAVNKTWYVTAATTPAAAINCDFTYSNADGNPGFNYTATVEHGLNITGVWNIDQSGLVPAPSGSNYIVSVPVSSFNGGIELPMVIGNLGSILAATNSIDLVAQKQINSAVLNWAVHSNDAIRELSIERSADGRIFSTLALVGIATNNFTDDKLLAGTNYYRIKMVAVNGKILYSSIVAVLNKETGFEMVSLLPNLIYSDAVLNITSAQKTKLNIIITDMMGRQVQNKGYNLIAGSNQFAINVAGLAAGTYHITGHTAERDTKTICFIKQ